MAAVISDTSPVRALDHLGLVDLLRQMFGQVLVPPGVAYELRHPTPGLPPIDISLYPFFTVQAPQNQAQVQAFLVVLDLGEAEALALAMEVPSATLILDERTGRNVAQSCGLSITGTLGVLVDAKQQGLIAAVRPLMDSLINDLSFFVSAGLYAGILRAAGE